MPSTPCRDLESIVTLLEVGALYLTESPTSRFTKDALYAQARDLAGPSMTFDTRDLNIVLAGCRFLKRERGGLLCIK